MKIRTGFVSNSSSSSYILALSKEDACEHCKYSNAKMIELVRNLFCKNEWDGNVPSSYSGDPENYIESIAKEIEDLEKDIEWNIKKIKVLENISRNDDALALLDEWDNIKKKNMKLIN